MVCWNVDSRRSLGTVQAKVGLGISASAFRIKDFDSIFVHSYIVYWGSVCFIVSAILAAATVNHGDSCLVKSALGMNALSATAAVAGGIMSYVELDRIELTPCKDPTSDRCRQALQHSIFPLYLKAYHFAYVAAFCLSIFLLVLVCKAGWSVVRRQRIVRSGIQMRSESAGLNASTEHAA